jgi:hypothetical protein
MAKRKISGAGRADATMAVAAPRTQDAVIGSLRRWIRRSRSSGGGGTQTPLPIRPAERLLSILIVEVGILVAFVSLAESALGPWISPGWIAAMMIAGWIAAPLAALLPAVAARPERLTRATGIVVFACGATSILIRSHEISDLTLLLLGAALFAQAAHRAPGHADPMRDSGRPGERSDPG